VHPELPTTVAIRRGLFLAILAPPAYLPLAGAAARFALARARPAGRPAPSLSPGVPSYLAPGAAALPITPTTPLPSSTR
jgi:hypothetical protein